MRMFQVTVYLLNVRRISAIFRSMKPYQPEPEPLRGIKIKLHLQFRVFRGSPAKRTLQVLSEDLYWESRSDQYRS